MAIHDTVDERETGAGDIGSVELDQGTGLALGGPGAGRGPTTAHGLVRTTSWPPYLNQMRLTSG